MRNYVMNAYTVQQRGRLHCFNYASSTIPLQVVKFALPGAEPRLWDVPRVQAVLQGHEPDGDMARISYFMVHSEDMDAADNMG